MAKKVLTPEEFQAKLEKKTAKRNLFFGTFTKALAFFLAIAIAWSLAAIAFAPTLNTGVVAGNNTTQQGSTTTPGGTTTPGSTTTPGGTDTPDTPNTPNTPSGTDTPSGDVNKTVADAVNAATAKAAKGSYEMERVCKYQEGKGINVKMLGGDATSVLNGVITAVDENASLDTVVGGFLGVGTKKIKVTNGAGKRYGSDGTMADLTAEEKDYLLKATNLSASDLASASVNGNVYTFTLANIADPQKDNKNPMHKATNDFITETQVKTAIGGITDAITVESAKVNYYSISFKATIENGNLKQLDMSYKADAVMKLKVALAIDGTGSMEVNTTYKF